MAAPHPPRRDGEQRRPEVTAAPPRTLGDLLGRFAARGDAAALVSIEAGAPVERTFTELVAAATRIAARVGAHHPQPGTAVALLAASGPAWVEAFWGIVAAGRTVVPLDVLTADTDLPGLLARGGCGLVVADTRQAERVRDLAPGYATLTLADAAAPGAAADIVSAEAGAAAVLVFTSGTTGAPKAVPLSHANLLANVAALEAARIVGAGDRALVPLPLHHIYPLTVGMLTVLASGAAIVFPEGLTGPQMAAVLHQVRVTALLGVPRLYAALLEGIRAEAARRGRLAARLFPVVLAVAAGSRRRLGVTPLAWAFRPLRRAVGPSLRLLVSGGAALAPELEARLLGLGWQVLTGYGLSETAPILTFTRPGRTRIGTVGTPLPGVALRIAAPDPDGVGEIEARGGSVFAGYRDDPAATAAAFTADGWFRTGDLGRLDAVGRLTVTGRARETIVLANGKKVDPDLIEAAYGPDPLIREFALLAGPTGLVALVVPDEDALRAAGALRPQGLIHDVFTQKGRRLPPYLRLAGLALTREALPRTPLGKLRRHLLPARFAAARHAAPAVPAPAAIPAPDAEPVLAWLRARYPGHRIDPDTSPQLDLGIDSLGWIALTLDLQRDLGIVLAEEQVARIVTVRDLITAAASAADVRPRRPAWPVPLGAGTRLLRGIGEGTVRAAVHMLFGLRVEGRARLPEPPFLLCPNHASMLDPFVLGTALPHRLLAVTWWGGWTGLLFRSAVRRQFSRAAQVLPVDPDRAVGAALELGAEALTRGNILVWFPEGQLSPDGSLGPFEGGVGAVLARMPAPAVPAWIAGSGAALPPGRRLPLPHSIRVRFGVAIDPAVIAPALPAAERAAAITAALRDAVARLGAGP